MKRILFVACLLLAFSFLAQAEAFQPRNAREGKLQALDCLMDCAFSAEYGDANSRLLRWERPLTIYVGGEPTKEDRWQLDDFIMELSFRVPLLPPVSLVDDELTAAITMYFVPEDQMKNCVTNYIEGNWGFVTYFYSDSIITRAEIAVASDVTTQSERNSILREEIVNAIGLGNDHYRYSDSVIYELENSAETLSEVDWLMLNMVYSPYTYPGMTADQAYRALLKQIGE